MFYLSPCWRIVLLLLWGGLCPIVSARTPQLVLDSLTVEPRPWSVEFGGSVGSTLATDHYVRQWLHGKAVREVRVGLRYHSAAERHDSVARAFGYPELGLHLAWSDFSGVLLRKYASPDWGQLVPVDYFSTVGQMATASFSFSRPLLQGRTWKWGYTIEQGIGYNTRPYRRSDNIDNELTGSRLLIFFGASAYARWQWHPRWSLRGELAFRHYSNGAFTRPNKGINYLSPQLTLLYHFDETAHFRRVRPVFDPRFENGWLHRIELSLGGHSLIEEWVRTQYGTPPSSPDYRTDASATYPTYNVQWSTLYRYSQKFASGVGVDGFFTPYVTTLRSRYQATHPAARYSPFSLGLALRHEANYGPWAFYVALGYYLHRQVGHNQVFDETPYYERVGMRFAPRSWRGLSVAAGVKAHKTKADFVEIGLGYTWR